jgi:hypothetical protein
MAPVLIMIKREHTRPNHPRRREILMSDRKNLTIPHHLNRQIAPGNQPAIYDRQPGYRFSRPQPVQMRVNIAAQVI